MQLMNDTLFFKDKIMDITIWIRIETLIVPLTTIYASLKSHRSDYNNDVLNLTCLLGLYLLSELPDRA